MARRSDDGDTDAGEVLLRFCEAEHEQGRQLLNERATMTNFIVIIAGASAGIVSQLGFDIKALPLAALLVILGLYGALSSSKLEERFQQSVSRLRLWRGRLDELRPEAKLLELRNAADAAHRQKYHRLRWLKVGALWLSLHVAVTLFGAGYAVAIILSARGAP